MDDLKLIRCHGIHFEKRFALTMQVYKQAKKHSQPPVSLEGQLLWREFFYTVRQPPKVSGAIFNL